MQKFKPMGVKGLWGMLQEAAEVEIPENKTLAIDVSIWIHYYKDMQEKDIIYNVSKRIIKLLYHNIKPVFIFDGTPNEMKRKVLIERKKLNNTKLIKDIVENRICKKCKKSIRTCRHGGMLNEKIRNDLENQIRVKLESHDERWGEDYKQDIELNVYHKPARYKQNKVVIDETLINDIVKSNKLTTKQKLKMLLKMREKRKEQLGYNDDTLTDFSDSQLVNIKKRNLISFYIRKLEKEKSSSKVQSNCYKEFTFKKDEKQTIQEINNKHIDSEVDTVEGESLDRLFSSDEESKSEEEIIDEQPSSNLDRLFNLCSSQLQDKVNNLDNDDHENNVLCFEPSSEIIDISKDKNPDCVNRPDLDEDSSSSSSQEINVENRDEEISFENIQRKNITSEDNETIYDFTNVQLIFKKTIEIFNLPYLVPPGEADSQCGYLSAQGIVDGVVTEDNDVLLYGGVVYRNFFRKNKHIEKFTPQKILENCKFTQIDLINISYVLGSDYSIGINGIGAKKVVDYIKSEDFLNLDIKKYQEIYLKPVINKHYKPKFNVIDLRKVIKYYKHKDIESDKINELIFYIKNIKK